MNATSPANPQTLNLYAYCANDSINQIDPSGLGFFSFLGKLFNVIGKILKIAAIVVAAFLIFVAFSLVGQPWAGGLIAKALIEAGLLLTYALAPPKISAAVGILVGIFTMKPPIIFNLSETAGHSGLRTLARVLGILVGITSVNDFLQQKKEPLPSPKPEPAPEGSSAGKRLPPCVHSRLKPYFPDIDLSRVRIFEGIPFYVHGDPPAYTEGNHIFFKKGSYDPNSVTGLAAIGHELTHTRQAAQLGFTRFAKRYLQEYFENRAAGMNDFDAYWNISFEIEARKVEAIIKKDLSNLSRDFGGRDPCPK
jgi:hypothetical protein